ncbi:MAG: DUF1549 and DUF1553 domain-containing protein [Isosphaeraceae bacterium]
MIPGAVGTLLVAATVVSASRPVDFETEVIPLLTRAGCNAGACHGAAVGRGGFRLSLFGADPSGDFDAIVRELEGRRIDLARPDESLVLAKPSGRIDHEGGVRLKPGGDSFDRLRDWLRQGAPRGGSRRLERFDVVPSDALAESPGETIALVASARFSDGSCENVSQWTVFNAVDSDAVTLTAQPGGSRATVTRPGRHVVLARFLDRVVPVTLTLPLGDRPVDLSQSPRVNFIDDEVLATLETLRLSPAPPADDATFLRRVRLDLTGRLPDPDEVRAFLADPERARLVDRLIASDDFADYWSYRLGELFRVGAVGQDREGATALHDWFKDRIVHGSPFDAMARELLTSVGDPRLFGPAHFYKVVGDARAQAEYTAEVFLGARLQCANCHNHPLDRWTQDDYHGLAALFARVDRGRDGVIRLSSRGEVTHPATGEPARPRIPGARDLDPGTDQDGRVALADWLGSPENPMLSQALVNRLWRALMGRGLVEPVDDLRATNPATHPALLDRLAADFVAHGADLRHTLRLIATSAAYARSGASSPDDRFYSRALERPLSVEVLVDALADVTGVAERFEDHPEGTRAIALVGPGVASESLDVLGRNPRRQGACDSSCDEGGGLTSALHRLNGPVVNRRLADPRGRLRRALASGRAERDVLDEIYLRALGRSPTESEGTFWDQRFAEAGPSAEARAALLEDAVWSLLNSSEFLTNH